jgi:hypothetical protein
MICCSFCCMSSATPTAKHQCKKTLLHLLSYVLIIITFVLWFTDTSHAMAHFRLKGNLWFIVFFLGSDARYRTNRICYQSELIPCLPKTHFILCQMYLSSLPDVFFLPEDYFICQMYVVHFLPDCISKMVVYPIILLSFARSLFTRLVFYV